MFNVLGMEVVKVGGPVYRIGVGGGSASSVQVHYTLIKSTFFCSSVHSLSSDKLKEQQNSYKFPDKK